MPYTPGTIPYSNPSTSRSAAESHADRAPTDEQIIYAAIQRYPRTCDALERDLGATHQTCSARIRGLVKRGLVHPSPLPDGSVKMERTRSGRLAIVWAPVNPDTPVTAQVLP